MPPQEPVDGLPCPDQQEHSCWGWHQGPWHGHPPPCPRAHTCPPGAVWTGPGSGDGRSQDTQPQILRELEQVAALLGDSVYSSVPGGMVPAAQVATRICQDVRSQELGAGRVQHGARSCGWWLRCPGWEALTCVGVGTGHPPPALLEEAVGEQWGWPEQGPLHQAYQRVQKGGSTPGGLSW